MAWARVGFFARRLPWPPCAQVCSASHRAHDHCIFGALLAGFPGHPASRGTAPVAEPQLSKEQLEDEGYPEEIIEALLAGTTLTKIDLSGCGIYNFEPLARLQPEELILDECDSGKHHQRYRRAKYNCKKYR